MSGDAFTEQSPVTVEDLNQQKLARDLLSSLDPEVVVDQEGNSRTIFTLHTRVGRSAKVMFYSPGEIPFVEAMKVRSIYIFGNRPVQRPEEEWGQFLRKIALNSGYGIVDSTLFNNHLPAHTVEDIQEGKASNMLLVEASPHHLLDLCIALGSSEMELTSLRSEFASRRLGSKETEFIDKIIAGKIIDDQGNFRELPNYEGEVLTILSLLGNEQAKRLSEQRLQHLRVSDQQRDALSNKIYLKQMERPAAQISREGLKPQQLVLVHATRYLPQTRNGNLEIISTLDASNWELPRNTIHFTLNHPVQEHLYYSWDAVPYVVIAPFTKLNEINGNPVNLSTVDTIYELSPGTTLKLPDGTVIVKPGELEVGRLWALDGEEVTYKNKNLSQEDIRTFATEMLQGREVKRIEFNDKIARWIEGTLRVEGNQLLSQQDISLLAEALKGIDIVQLLEKKPIAEFLEEFLVLAHLSENVPSPLKKELVGVVEGIFVSNIKESAIKGKIAAMGYPVFSGADTPDSDSYTYGRSLILAAQMGIPVATHEHHFTGEASDSLVAILNFLRVPENRARYGTSYNQMKEKFIKNLVPQISQKSRRMAYLLGVI